MNSLEGYYNGFYVWVGGYILVLNFVLWDLVFYMYYVYVDVVWECFWEQQVINGINFEIDYLRIFFLLEGYVVNDRIDF